MKIFTAITLIASLLNPISNKPIKNDRIINATEYAGLQAQISYTYSTGEALFSEGFETVLTASYDFPTEFYIDLNIHLNKPVEYARFHVTLTSPITSGYYLNYIGVNCKIASTNNNTSSMYFEMTYAQDCTIKFIYNQDQVNKMYGYNVYTDMVNDRYLNSWVSNGYTYCNITAFSIEATTIGNLDPNYTQYIDNIEGYVDNIESILSNQYTELQDISDYLANISTNSTLINTTLSNIDTNISSVNTKLTTMSTYLYQLTNLTMYATEIENSSHFGLSKLPNDILIKKQIFPSSYTSYIDTIYDSQPVNEQNNGYIVIHMKGIRTPYDWYYMPIPFVMNSSGIPVQTYTEITRNITVYDTPGKWIFQFRFSFRKEYDSTLNDYVVKFRVLMYRGGLSSSQNAFSNITLTESYIDKMYYCTGTFEPEMSTAQSLKEIVNILSNTYNLDTTDKINVDNSYNSNLNEFNQTLQGITLPSMSNKDKGMFNYLTGFYLDIINDDSMKLYKYGILITIISAVIKVIL